MREVHMWLAEGNVHDAFADIEELAVRCHFRDCSHTHETRCAVREALAAGQLVRERYDHFLKLKREIAFLEEARTQQSYAERNRSMRVARRAFNKSKRNQP
jgi:ribosome biogenesis GTPase